MLPAYLSFLNSPVDQEYFTKFVGIYSVNHNFSPVTFKLYKNAANGSREQVLYCDKILVGETLESALKRSLLSDFGLKLVDYYLLTHGIESAKNLKDESVSRFPVVVYVEYGNLPKNKVVDCELEWSIEDDYEGISWFKKHNSLADNNVKHEDVFKFMRDIYAAGALRVNVNSFDHMDNPNETVDELNPGFLEIRLPKDKEKRGRIFEVMQRGFASNSRNKDLSDSGQENVEYHW